MIPPCAQNVLQSFGSAAFVTSRTLIPAPARQNAVVSPAIPVPMTSTGQCLRFSRDTREVYPERGRAVGWKRRIEARHTRQSLIRLFAIRLFADRLVAD